MSKPLEKFQDLLCELFQFDCADLDFGIYRIMNHKRDAIERFITQELPRTIAAELDRGSLAEQSQATRELQGVTELPSTSPTMLSRLQTVCPCISSSKP